MRDGYLGMEYIENMMGRFGARHYLHMNVYGDDN
jgi:hypothetical protein